MHKENIFLEKVHDKIQKNIGKVLESIGRVPLFGAVGGSVALNLANEGSDIDFYLITDESSEDVSEVMVKCVDFGEVVVDFICVPITELERICVAYCKVEHFYPTRFYRDEFEMKKIRQLRDIVRPDFKKEMVLRIFMADKIFEFASGSAKKYYDRLKDGLLLIDVWDSYFSRAYGNFYEHIAVNKDILLRKYLYTISELTICHLLLTRKEKPIMNFEQMFAPPIARMWKMVLWNCAINYGKRIRYST